MTLSVLNKYLILIGFIIGANPYLVGQNMHKLDSIRSLNKDTLKVIAFLEYGTSIIYTNQDTAMLSFEEGKVLAENLNYYHGQAKANNDIGTIFYQKGNFDEALKYFNLANDLSPKIKDIDLIANSINNIGIISFMQGRNDEAIKFIMQGLLKRKSINDTNGIAGSLNSLGYIYHTLSEYDQSLKYYGKVLELMDTSLLSDDLDNIDLLMNCYNNIGLAYHKLNEMDSARYFYDRCLVAARKLDQPSSLATALNNLGFLYQDLKQLDKALIFYKECALIKEKFDHKKGLATVLNNIGSIYRDKKQFEKGLEFSLRSYTICDNLLSIDCIQSTSGTLSQLYEGLGDYKNALYYFQKSTEMKDSLFTADKSKEIGKLEAEFEYSSQKVIDDAEHEKLLTIEKEKQKRQYLVLIFSISGAFIFAIFLLIIYRRLQVTRRQKIIIEEQKEEVETQRDQIEEQRDDIISSINYAKRIQNAILPTDSEIKKYLPESFVLYKPKDVVAGDFYWLEENEGKVLFAAADCTGHGVPGAMVSVICNNGLNRAVREYGLTDPGLILDKTREIVIQEFEKSEEDVKDGMDIAICCIVKNKLHYSGAHNPLWLIRNNELTEIKADKQPIGKFDNQKPYSTHEINLQKKDSIYIFSDGFADQFGGQKDKKYGYRRFRELLISIQDKSMKEQKEIINSSFSSWMNESDAEQVDDVCVMGVRI